MASHPLAYSRLSRLLLPEQFRSALKTRPFARSALFLAHWSECLEADLSSGNRPKLGFIVPKRFARLSVRRNAIKRVLREAFRHAQHALPGGYYVVRLNANVPACSLTELKRTVRQQANALFDKAVSKT